MIKQKTCAQQGKDSKCLKGAKLLPRTLPAQEWAKAREYMYSFITFALSDMEFVYNPMQNFSMFCVHLLPKR